MKLSLKIKKSLFPLLLLLPLLTVKGQFVKKAQVGFRFLSNPVSAEAVGKGATGIATINNSNGIFWNPALLGLIENKYDLGLNHTRGIADINYNALSSSFNLEDIGVLGISFLSMDYGDFYTTRRAANDKGYVETGVFSPGSYAFGLAFSQKVTDKFSYGVHLKYVSQDLGKAWISSSGESLDDPVLSLEEKKYGENTIAADVGAYYDFHYKGIKFAAVLQNISQELKYVNEEFPLPFAVVFGATLQPLDFLLDMDENQSFVLSFESLHPRDFGEKIKIGAEFMYMKMFVLRAGYMGNYDERGFTGGIGFNYKISDIPFRIDYAFEPFGILGDRHYFSVGFSY